MSNLLARFLTAVVAVPFLILAINWKDPIGVELVVLLAAVLSMREWANMTLRGTPVLDRAFVAVLGSALFAALQFFGQNSGVYAIAGAASTIAVFLWFLFRFGDIERAAGRIAFSIAGIGYVTLLVFLSWLKRRDAGGPGDGGAWIYVALSIAWISDTGAYFAGRFLGPRIPRKLYETVSPKKTLVGFFGGIAGSYAALAVAKLWYLPTLSWADTALIAVPANLLGQMGDLCESLIKRSVGVKDSGTLLPGHGGMLDRIDALLFVVPYVWAYATWAFGRF